MRETRTGWRHYPWMLLALTVSLASCGGTTEPASPTLLPEATLAPTPIVPPTVDPAMNEFEVVAFSYYQALGIQRYDAARTLLTPELAAQLTETVLEERMAGTDAVGLVALIPQSQTPQRIIAQAIVSARSEPEPAGEYRFGPNNRYIEMVRLPTGWRIARITTEPIPPN